MRNMNALPVAGIITVAGVAGIVALSACGVGNKLVDAVPPVPSTSSSAPQPGKRFEVEFEDLSSGRPIPTYSEPGVGSEKSGLTYHDGDRQLTDCYTKSSVDRSDPLPGNAEVSSDIWFRLPRGDYVSGVWVILDGRLDEMSTCTQP